MISPEFECKALGIHHFYAAITSRKIFEAVNEALKTRLRILKNYWGDPPRLTSACKRVLASFSSCKLKTRWNSLRRSGRFSFMRGVKDSLEEVFVVFSCFVLLVFCDCCV